MPKPTDTTSSNLLASRAMIVTLRISQWSGRKLDREITQEVNTSHAAAQDASRVNKLLLDKAALEPIVKIVGETRSGFLTRTLPWVDDGSRIMSNHAHPDFVRWFDGQRAAFDGAVNDFAAAYPAHIESARVRLNGMFKLTDYPTVDEIRAKHAIEARIMPVPVADDFRVAMSEAQASAIRRDIERNVADATNGAVRDVYRRVEDVARKMVDRLGAYDDKKDGERTGFFRDSLVSNVRDLIGFLPSLNITGAPEIDALAAKLAPLAEFDAKVLREDKGKRSDAAAAAQRILDDIGGLLA